MRDIKFRAWDSENRQMLDVQELNFEDCFYGGGMQIKTTMYNDYFDYREMPLMQYTGLKDKNGVEIYEGDIILIKDDTEKLIVKWYDGSFVLVNKYDEHFEGYVALYRYMPIEIEVIGNIHDNPELLKAGD